MTTQMNIEELETLLPFYVNGTLSASERSLVDAALAGSEPLRTALTQTVFLAHRIKADSIAFMEGGSSQDSQLTQVMARIDALLPGQRSQAQISSKSPPMSLRARLAFLSPNRWHPAVSLGLVVAVLAQGAMLMNASFAQRALETNIAARDKQVKELEFQLASGPGAQTPAGNIVIQIDSNVRWSKVEAILVAENLVIVSGPQDGTLTLSSVAKGDELDAVVARLRASPLIASADKAR